jgi:TPR repeat protein
MADPNPEPVVVPIRDAVGGPTGMTASIFISYASKDRAAAHTICEALEHRGFDCWIADRDIGPGENFQVSIVHAIRSAKVMILVFSANAANSEEIKKEVVLAGQSRLVVIPVRVEDVTPDEAFAYEMATRQWVDLFDDWEQSIQRLVRQLEAVAHIKSDFKIAAGTPVTEQGVSQHKEPPSPSFPEPAAESSLASKPAAPSPKKLDWRLIAAPGGTAAVIAAVLALWLSFGHSNSSVLQHNPAVNQAVGEVVLQRGREAFQRKDYAEAMRLYRAAADQGNAQAQSNIGSLYENGLGVAQDYVEAGRWYRKAADQGNASSQNNVGWLFQQGQDYTEAMGWYRKAADQGNAVAQANIGWLYQSGLGVAQDYAEAMRWGRKAADQGNAVAQANIGWLYQKGLGVAQDYAEAMRWYRKAADQGNAVAQRDIGWLYQNGWGVAQDSAEAQVWMQKAAAAGDDNAKRWLASHQASGLSSMLTPAATSAAPQVSADEARQKGR